MRQLQIKFRFLQDRELAFRSAQHKGELIFFVLKL
nr:MAG TPA: hypothetical protein [Caudoviricetes sp.]